MRVVHGCLRCQAQGRFSSLGREMALEYVKRGIAIISKMVYNGEDRLTIGH